MNLRITSPLEIVVDEATLGLRASDSSGSFGILPNHADFLTRLALSVVSWKTRENVERYCAVRGGVLIVKDGDVAIATREAIAGDNLDVLDRDVLARFRSDLEEERAEHVETTRLELNVMRRMVARLKPRKVGETSP